MKAIKRIIGLTLMVALTITSVMAQTLEMKKEKNPTVQAQKKTERMTQNLSLTAEQTAKVAEINSAYAEKIATTRKGTDKAANRTAVKALKADQKMAIKEVLTAEQVTKYEAQKGRKGGKKGKKGAKGAKKGAKGAKGAKKSPEERAQNRTDRLTKTLGLSSTQAAQVTDINTSYGEKIKAIKDNATDKEASRAEVKTLKAEQKSAIKAILTPEQVTKFDAMKTPKGKKHKKGRKKGTRQM